MAKEDDRWDLEKRPMPVIAAPPANIDARPRSAAAAAGDDEDDRKIPNCVWVSLQLLVTAVLCCPLLALAMTRTDSVEKAVLSVVMLPVVVGVFFVLRAMCDRPRMALVAAVLNR
uniref:Uncharacterized protein n=1 Tax=Avena sativa TaxID=4498 RepID=A0ACD6A4L7_AVESA